MTKYKHSWQWTGQVPFIEVLAWCRQHRIVVSPTWETLYFTNERDYTLFLLRWA